MRIILFIFSVLFAMQASAQRKFHFDIDYQYSLGLYEHNKFTSWSRKDFSMSGHTIHLAGRYDITPKISVGLGTGIDVPLNPDGGWMLPVYATVRYKPLVSVRGFYTFADLGCGFIPKTEEYDYNVFKGGIANLGAGYTWYMSKNFGLNFKVGYGLMFYKGVAQFFKDDNWLNDFTLIEWEEKFYSFRHSVIFSVGLTF